MPGDLGSSFGGIGFDVEAHDLISDTLDEAQRNVREFADTTREGLQEVSDEATSTGESIASVEMSTRQMGYEIREGTMGMMHIGHSFLLLSNYAHQLGGDFGGLAAATGTVGAAFTSIGTAGYTAYGVMHILRFAQGELVTGIYAQVAAWYADYTAEVLATGGLMLVVGAIVAYTMYANNAASATSQLAEAQKDQGKSTQEEYTFAEKLTSLYKDLGDMKQQLIDLNLKEKASILDLEDAQLGLLDATDNYNSKMARQKEIEAALNDPKQIEMKKLAHQHHMKLADVQKELQHELSGAAEDTQKANIAMERAALRITEIQNQQTSLVHQQQQDEDKIKQDMLDIQKIVDKLNMAPPPDTGILGAVTSFFTGAYDLITGKGKEFGGWVFRGGEAAAGHPEAPSVSPELRTARAFSVYIANVDVKDLSQEQINQLYDKIESQYMDQTKQKGSPTNTGGG